MFKFEFTYGTASNLLPFISGVAETALGAAIGFGLGLIGFHYQQKHQREVEKDSALEASVDALNRLLQASVLNIETLANAKIQLLNDLEPEVAKMKLELERYYANSQTPTKETVDSLLKLTTSLTNFYKTLPQLPIMDIPDLRELSQLTTEMPGLSAFTHRAMSTMNEINSRLNDRNNLVALHSSEVASSGVRPFRFLYFCQMLTDLSDHICQSADNGLEFFKIIMDQIEYYSQASTAKTKVMSYELIPVALDQLPKENLFPALRDQIVKFDKTSKK